MSKISGFIVSNRTDFAILVGVVALLVVADSEPGVHSIMQDKSILQPRDMPVAASLITTACMYILLGTMGMWVASRLDLPVWWHSRNSESSRETAFIIALGATIVVLNIVIMMSYVAQAARHPDIVESSSHWILSITPRTAVALSLHAAVTEEILFRLFSFSAATWAASHFLGSKRDILITGAVISCFLFGLMHPGMSAFLFSFVLGFPMIYIYSRRGLIPVMIIHFLADSIPFVIISVIQ